MSIPDDEWRENASVENSLMKKAKKTNEFEEKQKKKKKEKKKPYSQRIKERMGKCYEEKPFKIQAKRKKIVMMKFQVLLTKAMKTLREKKLTETETMTVESKRVKTTIKHPRERKNFINKKWRKIIQNCSYPENLTLIPKKCLINYFYST